MLKHQVKRHFCLFAQGCCCRLSQAHRTAQLGRIRETQEVMLKKRTKCKTTVFFCFLSETQIKMCLSAFNKQLFRVKVTFVFQGRREIPKRWHSQVRLSQTLSQMTPIEVFIKSSKLHRERQKAESRNY